MAGISPRDNQKSKLYYWEQVNLFDEDWNVGLTPTEMQEVTDMTWAILGLDDPPKIVHSKRKYSRCTAHLARNEIRFAARDGRDWGNNICVLAHELAHIVVNRHGLTGHVEAHGPEFVHYYGKILCEWIGKDRGWFYELASRGGIRTHWTYDPVERFGQNVYNVVFNADTDSEFVTPYRGRDRAHVTRTIKRNVRHGSYFLSLGHIRVDNI